MPLAARLGRGAHEHARASSRGECGRVVAAIIGDDHDPVALALKRLVEQRRDTAADQKRLVVRWHQHRHAPGGTHRRGRAGGTDTVDRGCERQHEQVDGEHEEHNPGHQERRLDADLEQPRRAHRAGVLVALRMPDASLWLTLAAQ